MADFKNIEEKLRLFIRKYYTNELIKGVILFLSLGFLYLLFTLFLEYFLWLKPTARTILFWLFIFIEGFLLIRFIAIPIFKLVGLQKGISFSIASKIIGNHFPEVQDKLLNVLQLKEYTEQSDLILASIHQKSEALQPIPFVKAIDFKKNSKYLKYAIIPIVIFVTTLLSGNKNIFTQSLDRIVHHKTAYIPPAPFSFFIQNKNLQVVQGKPFTILVSTQGKVLPNEAKVQFEGQQYYLQNNGNGTFSYTFSDVQKPIQFFITANNVRSQEYQIDVLFTPTISNISLLLKYPNYLKRKNIEVANTGNITVPDGTKITWLVHANQTDSVAFISQEIRKQFNTISTDNFEYSQRVTRSLNYQISTSNKSLRDYEKLQFSVAVVKDEFPLISVKSNIDSITRGTAQFAGQISDDYGLQKLQLVYYDITSPEIQQTFDVPITNKNIQTFFYQFPDGISLNSGINYELFFRVFDNDAVNGNKYSKSIVFKYRKKTNEEVDEELLQEQRNSINAMESSLQKQREQQQVLEKINQDLQGKKKLNWSDNNKVKNFIKRQNQYKQMMQQQANKLQENLKEKKEKNETLQNKKDELKKRIQELKKLDKQQKLLDEIQKMAEKLNKEDLLKKAKELAQHNKQQERSLERILELTKRFYVEQKTMQIANKIEKLAKEQDVLQQQKDTSLEDQKEIKKEFDSVKKELQELEKDNEKLKEPMALPDVEDEKDAVDKELKKVENKLTNQHKKEAKENQKKASKKMQEMSAKMQKAMQEMEGESMEENMDDLRNILENLVTFSFKQENLMVRFTESSTSHPDFGKELKKQNEIKTYFEHIDDSLYVLSMRLPKISAKIQNHLSSAHYNLEQSLENFSENRFPKGTSNQRYVITAANDLSHYLSATLDNMKNSMSMKMGKGKGKGSGFSLPDLIKKQGELSEKMKEGMKKGNKLGSKPGGKPGNKKKEGEKGQKSGEKGKSGQQGKNGKNKKGQEPGKDGGHGNGSGENDDLDGELYEIYKQQSLLRQQLQEAIKEAENGKPGGNSKAKKTLKTMEQLENEILEKGFNAGTLQKMQNLNYELLKLEKATLEQGKDKKRNATSNLKEYQKNKVMEIKFKKLFYNQTEILNRQSLPLQQNYKKKVRDYFLEPQKNKR